MGRRRPRAPPEHTTLAHLQQLRVVMPARPPTAQPSYGSMPALYRHRSKVSDCERLKPSLDGRQVKRRIPDQVQRVAPPGSIPVEIIHGDVELVDFSPGPDQRMRSAAAMGVEVDDQDALEALSSARNAAMARPLKVQKPAP